MDYQSQKLGFVKILNHFQQFSKECCRQQFERIFINKFHLENI